MSDEAKNTLCSAVEAFTGGDFQMVGCTRWTVIVLSLTMQQLPDIDQERITSWLQRHPY